MNYQKEEMESKNIDHLGIIAGIIDEIGIVKKNQRDIFNRYQRESKHRRSSQSNYSEWTRLCIKTTIFIPRIFSR